MKKIYAAIIFIFISAALYAEIFYVDFTGKGGSEFNGTACVTNRTIKYTLISSVNGIQIKKTYTISMNSDFTSAYVVIKDFWNGELTFEDEYDQMSIKTSKDFVILQIGELGITFAGFSSKSLPHFSVHKPDATIYNYDMDEGAGGK